MRFGLCVRFGVDLHVRLIEEGRRAHPAPTGGETWEWKNKWDEEMTQNRTQETMMVKEKQGDGRI